MPRRGNEVVQLPMPPRKKTKTIELPPAPSTISLDVSFSDDEALTPGIIFTDIQQKKWRIGKPIGEFIPLIPGYFKYFDRKLSPIIK